MSISICLLPDEIIEHILKYTDYQSCVSISSSCKLLLEISRRDSVWRVLFENDIGVKSILKNLITKPASVGWLWMCRAFSKLAYVPDENSPPSNKEDSNVKIVGYATNETQNKMSLYGGEWMNGLHHGYGIYIVIKMLTDGSCTKTLQSSYFGDWQSGNRHGFGMRTWRNGIRYIGTWRDDKMHGYGEKIYPAGTILKGTFSEGVCTHGEIMYPTGNKYRGDMNKSGHRHGFGVYLKTNGIVLEGKWLSNRLEGEGTIRWTDGDSFCGYFHLGKRIGLGRLITKDGQILQQTWNEHKFDENNKGNTTKKNRNIDSCMLLSDTFFVRNKRQRIF